MLTRTLAIEALTEQRFDVAVIGGGITGAGVALDAASRGYSVALLERADFASGTSSRSSKLVHGGLRYLQNFDLGLVRESLLERQLMVKLARHLVTPLPMVVPAFDGARPDRLMGIGLHMYDVMATPGLRRRRAADAGWSRDRHRMITGPEVADLLPALAARHPTGGYLFFDCQTDDVRLVLTILGEAERFGAVCANRVEVIGLRPAGHRRPTATAVTVNDTETDTCFTVQAENVVNATGVWADRVLPEELRAEAELPKISPSRGAHLTLDSTDLPLRAGVIIPAADHRSVFALPWLGRSLIGTTDNPYPGGIDHVSPALDEIDYLLNAVNAFFGTGLGLDHLTGAYAGVRPLISAGDSRKSVDISRRAALYETSSGLITITGGKLTTWRRMAKLAVDRIVEREGRRAPCHTHEIPLGEPVAAETLPRIAGIGPSAYQSLAARYGYAARRVLDLAATATDPALVEPIVDGLPDLLVEAPFSARYEQARTVADVLFRRTRVALLAAPQLREPESAVPRRVACALARELGWDGHRIEREVNRFHDEADAEGITLGGAVR